MKAQEIINLLRKYSFIMRQLRAAGILRSSNNPVADYAEYLVAKRLKLKLAPNSNKSVDAINPKTKTRYQIKSRRITEFSNSRQLGVIRSLDFDFVIAVIFKENFEISEVYKIPKKIILKYARFSKHQNGYILILFGAILKDKNLKKIKIWKKL